MALNKRQDKLVRKVDSEGVEYVGRVHGLDIASGLRMSRWLLKNASTDLVFEYIGTYSRSSTGIGWNIPAGTEFPLRFTTLDISSLGVGVVANETYDTYKITKTGLYYIEGMDTVNVPVSIQPTYAYLKLKRNSNIYRVLDGEPMEASAEGTAVYHHFWFLKGGTFGWFDAGDTFQIILEFGSGSIPPGSLTTSNLHTCYFSIHYIGDGWAE